MTVYTVGTDEIFEEVNDFGNDYTNFVPGINFDEDDYWELDVIYESYLKEEGDELSWFFSPDGIGRVFYDTLEEAQADTGIEKVNWLNG